MNAIVAHTEIIIIAVNQTVWFHDEWEEFASKIASKIGNFDLTPKDLLEVYEKFLYFYNQLSRFERTERTLKRELQKTGVTLPETLTYLSHIQKDLIALYQRRSRILWEMLSKTINVSGKPQSFDAIPKDYFLNKSNPIKKLLLALTDDGSREQRDSSSTNSEQSLREESSSDSPPQVRTITTLEVPLDTSDVSSNLMSIDSEKSTDVSSQSVGSSLSDLSSLSTDLHLGTPVHSELSLVSGSGTSSPQSVRSSNPLASPVIKRNPIKISTPPLKKLLPPQDGSLVTRSTPNLSRNFSSQQDEVLEEVKEPSIEMFRDGSVQNTNFVARFKEAFAQPPEWRAKVKDFKRDVKFLRNVKFVLHPLKKLFESYDTFKESHVRNNDRARDFLTPPASLRMQGQPSTRIYQSTAYKMCSMKYSGSLCMGISNLEEQSTVELCHTMGDLVFAIRENYPFRIGAKLALYYLEALFGIHSAPSTLVTVDGVRTLKPVKPIGQNSQQYNACVTYLNDTSTWELNLEHEFVMAQQTTTNQTTVDAWLHKVVSGDRPFDELCPFSYGVTTLFSILTRSKALGDKYVLVQNNQGKLAFKRTDFNPFLDPSFQEHKGNHLFVGQNILYELPYVHRKIPEDVKQYFRQNNIELICAYWLTFLQRQQEYFNKLIVQYNLANTSDELDMEDLNQDVAYGFSMARLADTIPFLLSTFHKMVTLLENPSITYRQLFYALRPYEALLYPKKSS